MHKQCWIALINNGYEAWSLVRRTDMFTKRTDPVNTWISSEPNGETPKRLRYSTTDVSLNSTQAQAAIFRLDQGDRMGSRVWWDVR